MNKRKTFFRLMMICLALGTAACSSTDTANLPDTYPLDLDHQATGPDLARWGNDLQEALALAAENGRPVLALYRDGGAGGLTAQPLMAEAAEDLFIPLLLPAGSARDGEDCRIFDARERDLVPPADAVETPGQLALMMVRAVEAGNGRVPRWLRLVAEENGAEGRRMISLAMFCFWEGEAKLGNLDGVLATRSGMMDQDEVVEVVYDPQVLGLDALVRSAQKMDCASAVYAHTADDLDQARKVVGDRAKPAPERARMVDDDQVKYALKRTPMARLPLTPMQAAKINADIRLEENPSRWLSPRQLKMLDSVKRLLEEDPAALDDFSPPGSIALLAEYQARLQKRLGIK